MGQHLLMRRRPVNKEQARAGDGDVITTSGRLRWRRILCFHQFLSPRYLVRRSSVPLARDENGEIAVPRNAVFSVELLGDPF